MKRLLVFSLLAAAVAAPAALAITNTVPKPITVATSSGVTPSGPLYISRKFSFQAAFVIGVAMATMSVS